MAPTHANRPSWDSLRIRRGKGPALSGSERLVTLVRWLRNEGSPEDQFFDPVRTCMLVDPMDVNWARFPVQEALEAAAASPRATIMSSDSHSSSRPPSSRRLRGPKGSNGTITTAVGPSPPVPEGIGKHREEIH